MHIAVVDDDPAIRALLCTELELAGHDATAYADGAEALTGLTGWRPDAIVLDVMMPGVSGWQVLAAVRAGRDPDVPVVLLSARDLPDDVRRGYELGASVVLPKPYDADKLLVLLETLSGQAHRTS